MDLNYCNRLHAVVVLACLFWGLDFDLCFREKRERREPGHAQLCWILRQDFPTCEVKEETDQAAETQVSSAGWI